MVTVKYSDDSTGFEGHIFVRNGEPERRLGFERRRFRYDVHIPERRAAVDRRNGTDRESPINVAAARWQQECPKGYARIPSQAIVHSQDVEEGGDDYDTEFIVETDILKIVIDSSFAGLKPLVFGILKSGSNLHATNPIDWRW